MTVCVVFMNVDGRPDTQLVVLCID